MDGRPHLTPEERKARLHLSLVPGFGAQRIRALVGRFGSASAALVVSRELFEGVAGSGSASARAHAGIEGEVRRVEGECQGKGVRILAPGFRGYPLALERMDPPPPVLYALGTLGVDRPRRVVVVGARKASGYGRRVARRLGRELAEQGCTVISGMALGVDGEAHEGALEGGGVTAAVLGSGPDRAYPAVHTHLHRRIAGSGGILSEHPPGTRALPHHFPRRNLILAGLAEVVVVVEAARRSGSLITAGASPSATVCAVPGSVESPLSRGTFELIRDGAVPITCGGDVLEAMGWPPLRPGGVEVPAPDGLGRVEGVVWRLLDGAPSGVEELARRAGLPPVRVLSALGVLEVGGWVQAGPGGRFSRTSPAALPTAGSSGPVRTGPVTWPPAALPDSG